MAAGIAPIQNLIFLLFWPQEGWFWHGGCGESVGLRFYYIILAIVLLLVGSGRCFPQGVLNQGEPAVAQDALPDWSAYFEPVNDATRSGNAPAQGHDGISIGAAVTAIQDTNAPLGSGPIRGKYSAPSEGSTSTATSTPALGQTGTIPLTVQSLVFSTNNTGTLDVSFNGHALTLVDVSNAMNCTDYKANFPADAGQTASLLTPLVETAPLLNNIQYSASIAPDVNPLDCP